MRKLTNSLLALLLMLGVFGTASAAFWPPAHRAIDVNINVCNGPPTEVDMAIIDAGE